MDNQSPSIGSQLQDDIDLTEGFLLLRRLQQEEDIIQQTIIQQQQQQPKIIGGHFNNKSNNNNSVLPSITTHYQQNVNPNISLHHYQNQINNQYRQLYHQQQQQYQDLKQLNCTNTTPQQQHHDIQPQHQHQHQQQKQQQQQSSPFSILPQSNETHYANFLRDRLLTSTRVKPNTMLNNNNQNKNPSTPTLYLSNQALGSIQSPINQALATIKQPTLINTSSSSSTGSIMKQPNININNINTTHNNQHNSRHHYPDQQHNTMNDDENNTTSAADNAILPPTTPLHRSSQNLDSNNSNSNHLPPISHSTQQHQYNNQQQSTTSNHFELYNNGSSSSSLTFSSAINQKQNKLNELQNDSEQLRQQIHQLEQNVHQNNAYIASLEQSLTTTSLHSFSTRPSPFEMDYINELRSEQHQLQLQIIKLQSDIDSIITLQSTATLQYNSFLDSINTFNSQLYQLHQFSDDNQRKHYISYILQLQTLLHYENKINNLVNELMALHQQQEEQHTTEITPPLPKPIEEKTIEQIELEQLHTNMKQLQSQLNGLTTREQELLQQIKQYRNLDDNFAD